MLCCIISSCSKFSPTEENYVEVQVPQTVLSIDLDATTDTLYSFGVIKLQYSTLLQNGQFAFVRILADDVVVDSVANDSAYVLDTSDWNDGTYQLKLEVWARTMTNSVADFLQEEFELAQSREYPMVIVNRIPTEAPRITSIQLENGSLTIRWQKFLSPNFGYYAIFRTGPRFSSSVTIPDWRTTHYSDPLYVGGPVRYRIGVGGNGFSLDGSDFSFTNSAPEIQQLSVTEDGQALIEWARCPTDSNFKYYTVVRSVKDTIATLTNIEQTSFRDPGFGFGETSYRILIIPRKDPDRFITSQPATVKLGHSMPAFERLWYVPSSNSYYIDGPSMFYRVNASNFDIEASIRGGGGVSSNANLCFVVTDITKMYRVDPLTLDVLETIKLSDIVDYGDASNVFRERNFLISNSGFVSYESGLYRGSTYRTDGINVIDINTRSLLGNIGAGSQYSSALLMRISDDGKYLIARHGNNNLYEIRNDGIEHLFEIKDSVHPLSRIRQLKFCFLNAENSLVLTDEKKIRILRLPDLTIDRQFDIEADLQEARVDFTTNLLGGFTEDENRRYRIYDLNTGDLVHEFGIMSDDTDGYTLLNSTIFSKRGLYMKLDLPGALRK